MAPPKSAPKPAPRPLLTVPDLEDFERLGRKALKSLPEPLRAQTRDVMIIVEDFPDDDVTEMMNLDTPYDLLGLYQGVALPERSIADVGRLPDCIHLYRRPILDYWCESGERLDAIIHHVLLHEIGHHFGLSDDDMYGIEDNEP